MHRLHRRAGRARRHRHRHRHHRDGHGSRRHAPAGHRRRRRHRTAAAAAVVTAATAATGTATCRGARAGRRHRAGGTTGTRRAHRDAPAPAGRGGMLPGEAPPGRGAPGLGAAPGRGACGRGMGRSTGCAEENGLLPTRGGTCRRLRAPGPDAGPGSGPGGAPRGCAALRVPVPVAAAGAGAGAGGAGGGAGGGGRCGGPRTVRLVGGAARLRAPPGPRRLDGGFGSRRAVARRCLRAVSGLPPPNDSRSRRATGASTVDDADLTNSPCSLSRARTSLLVTPSSLANSCTRALPATTSPV